MPHPSERCIALDDACTAPEQCCDSDEFSTPSLSCYQLATYSNGTTDSACLIDDVSTSNFTVINITGTECCSFNLTDCVEDQWCNLGETNCVDYCFGFWIDTNDTLTSTCVARWEPCVDDSDCCSGDLAGGVNQTCELMLLDGSNDHDYTGCKIDNSITLPGSQPAEGCVEIYPDFSCEERRSWEYCFKESFNRAFENRSFVDEIDLSDSCHNTTDSSVRRFLGNKKNRVKGRCKCCDPEFLIDIDGDGECFRDGRSRRHLSNVSDPLDGFRAQFHQCLICYLPERMENITVDEVILTGYELSKCE